MGLYKITNCFVVQVDGFKNGNFVLWVAYLLVPNMEITKLTLRPYQQRRQTEHGMSTGRSRYNIFSRARTKIFYVVCSHFIPSRTVWTSIDKLKYQLYLFLVHNFLRKLWWMQNFKATLIIINSEQEFNNWRFFGRTFKPWVHPIINLHYHWGPPLL